MEYFDVLEKKIRGLGWYSGTLSMEVKVEGAFEGYSGRASETWEYRTTIEIKSPDEKVIPSVKVVGKRFDRIDDVAKRVLMELKK